MGKSGKGASEKNSSGKQKLEHRAIMNRELVKGQLWTKRTEALLKMRNTKRTILKSTSVKSEKHKSEKGKSENGIMGKRNLWKIKTWKRWSLEIENKKGQQQRGTHEKANSERGNCTSDNLKGTNQKRELLENDNYQNAIKNKGQFWNGWISKRQLGKRTSLKRTKL